MGKSVRRKSAIRILCFLLILAAVLWKTNNVLSFKFADGNTILTDFYRLEKNTLDVAIIGSSHAYVNFSPGTLWDEYGIASYVLGSSMQPMWNSYYYLKEALKTQKPELIVLEGFGLTYKENYSTNARIIKNVYGMKWSLDKIRAALVSAKKGHRREFLLEYARYHTRYSTLNRGDFFPESEYMDSNDYWHYTDTMGQYLFDTSRPITIRDVSNVRETKDLSEKTEKYFRMTIELAQEKGIPIVVVVAPHGLSEDAQRKYLRAQEIAEEYGVGFLNVNLLLGESGIDPAADYHDSAHMTVEGSRKLSLYVGKYLKDNYELSDRRGDERYKAWDSCAAYIKQYRQNMILKNSSDLDTISGLLSNPNYRLLLSLDGSADVNDGTINSFLAGLGIDTASQSTMWMKEGGSLSWDSASDESEKYISTELHDICIRKIPKGNGSFSGQMIVDNEQYQKVKNGLNVVVFDALTDRVADSFGIDADDNDSIVR